MAGYSTLAYIKDHAPSLLDLWVRYSIHDAVMVSNWAGPQKQAKDYDPTEEQHFGFEVDDPRIRDDESVLFTCYQDRVELAHLFSWKKDKEPNQREDHVMTHENCLKYLDQLPRPWHSYCS